MRLIIASALLAITVSTACMSAQMRTANSAQAGTLLAHDINGYSLDMTLAQVEAVAKGPLESIGGGQYKMKVNVIDYDFGFSVLGHLFRIDSDQDLGNFIPDRSFAKTLTERMAKKYGLSPDGQPDEGPIGWAYTEKHAGSYGTVNVLPTVELSAYWDGGDGQPVMLHIHLIDFRIMRRDIDKANVAPEANAEHSAKF